MDPQQRRRFDRMQRQIRRGIEGIIGTPPGLLDIFEKDIRAEHILERLASCRGDQKALDVRRRMEHDDFDILGVRQDGSGIEGYVVREELVSGTVHPCIRSFHAFELASESTPLLDVLREIRDRPRLFIVIGTSVGGIVTRADLQKAPVRLLLFGLITSLETLMLGLVRSIHEGDSWTTSLAESRVAAAQVLLERRQARNEAIDLADCLQICDKRDILFKSPRVVESLGFESKSKATATFKRIEALRDRLAHSQDLIAGSTWEDLIDLVEDMDDLLHRIIELARSK